jgi:hypothetical protein
MSPIMTHGPSTGQSVSQGLVASIDGVPDAIRVVVADDDAKHLRRRPRANLMRILAHFIFACWMVTFALNLSGCSRADVHPSTPNLQWVD